MYITSTYRCWLYLQELDVQPLIDAGLFPSLVYVLYCLISSTISPNEQTISVDNGGSIDSSNTSTVEDEGLEPGEASSATNPKVADAGTEEVSALPGLNPGETVAVNERSPSDSSELQSKNVSLSSEGVILGEPSLAAVDEVETANVVEGTCLNEESANKEAEVSIGVLDEVPMEERRALVHTLHVLAHFFAYLHGFGLICQPLPSLGWSYLGRMVKQTSWH